MSESYINRNVSDFRFISRNLRNANFTGAVARRTDFSGADLSFANFSRADLTRADFRGANLLGAHLSRADLTNADFRGANMRSASMFASIAYGANFRGAELDNAQFEAILANPGSFDDFHPNDGTEVGWKAVVGALLRIEVPYGTARTMVPTSRKRRAERVLVKDAFLLSNSSRYGDDLMSSMCGRSTVYKVGETVTADYFDPDWRVECSHGIHYFETAREAGSFLSGNGSRGAMLLSEVRAAVDEVLERIAVEYPDEVG